MGDHRLELHAEGEEATTSLAPGLKKDYLFKIGVMQDEATGQYYCYEGYIDGHEPPQRREVPPEEAEQLAQRVAAIERQAEGSPSLGATSQILDLFATSPIKFKNGNFVDGLNNAIPPGKLLDMVEANLPAARLAEGMNRVHDREVQNSLPEINPDYERTLNLANTGALNDVMQVLGMLGSNTLTPEDLEAITKAARQDRMPQDGMESVPSMLPLQTIGSATIGVSQENDTVGVQVSLPFGEGDRGKSPSR